ncbi:tyrosine-type recombinase/integrase [archaeon]|nr:tyrosine-type recombinase/integrase [archaeon]MBT6761886.1 tyrosine-type recombinase/integrase [archaeon]
MDIHDFAHNFLKAQERVEKSQLSKRNKELISKFIDDLTLQNIGTSRLIKYTTMIRIVAGKLDVDLDTATIEDIRKYVSEIQRSSLSPWTKKDYKGVIRKFYKWHYQCKGKNKYPPIVDWITTTVKRSEKKLPSSSDLHLEEDIKKMLNTAENSRDRAFVAILWESGCRISEIGNLQIKQLSFDKLGVMFNVQGKTGSRKIRLISSTAYIASWLNDHPLRHNRDAALWVNFRGQRKHQAMKYRNIRKMLQELARKAGIQKKVNPHIFRHSRATFMASHLTEFQMNQYFGWIQGSDMPSTYVHLNGKEVENAILKLNGIEIAESKKEQQMKPKICTKCNKVNSFDSLHCSQCGTVLDLKLALEMDETQSSADDTMAKLLKDKDVQSLLLKKLRSLI